MLGFAQERVSQRVLARQLQQKVIMHMRASSLRLAFEAWKERTTHMLVARRMLCKYLLDRIGLAFGSWRCASLAFWSLLFIPTRRYISIAHDTCSRSTCESQSFPHHLLWVAGDMLQWNGSLCVRQ